MRISIFGLGYVGCISLGCLAKNGHFMIGVDVNEIKVNLINQGLPTIIEKDIDLIIKEQYEKGNLYATTNYREALLNTDITIICVGTPSTDNGHLNLDYIFETARQIGTVLKEKDSFHYIAIRSTVHPGTNYKVGEIIENISGKKRNEDFAIISNPEFLREGSAVYDYYNPPYTVLGSDNEKALNIMEDIYKDINAPVIKVDIEVAEIIKYINNSFHALKITFANEIGNICKAIGIDSYQVMELVTLDKQLNLSPYYLKPGFAFGGSCLPKDLKGLRLIAHDNYINVPLLDGIEKSNENQKLKVIQIIEKINSKNIGIIGLSFKPNTDDFRYSPLVEVAEHFLGKGYNLFIYDKNLNLSNLIGVNKDYIQKNIPHLSKLLSKNIDDVIDKSDIIIISQKFNDIENCIEKYPNKYFVDLIRVTDKKYSNYEGICW